MQLQLTKGNLNLQLLSTCVSSEKTLNKYFGLSTIIKVVLEFEKINKFWNIAKRSIFLKNWVQSANNNNNIYIF